MSGTVKVFRLTPIPSISVQAPSVYPVFSMLATILFLQTLSCILQALSSSSLAGRLSDYYVLYAAIILVSWLYVFIIHAYL
jgi:hypothetical protein